MNSTHFLLRPLGTFPIPSGQALNEEDSSHAWYLCSTWRAGRRPEGDVNSVLVATLISVLSLCLLPSLNAQTASLVAPGVSLEIGGVAPDYSLNYTQHIFTTDKVSAYWRIGTGLWKNRLAFPLGIGLLLGKQDHHPEFVFAITPYSQGLAFWERDKSDLFLDLVMGLAYRYQPMDQSFFISGGVFPYLHLDPTTDMISEEQAKFRFRAGLSVGWFFN